MASSRRKFLEKSILAAGPFILDPMNEVPDAGGVFSSDKRSASSPRFEAAYLKAEREGKLSGVETELWDILKSCRCCPRACGANRLRGEKGICRSAARLKVHSYAPHFGEERPLVGRGGSGTIFFSNCNLLCCFCQNWQINHRGDGEYVDLDDLAGMMISLQRQGCHNINLVTPTHVAPHIVKALRIAIARGLRLPLVWNSGGYDDLEIIKKLECIVDIYLPDFKYQNGEMAAKYSSGASDYPQVAAQAIKEMHRQVGVLKCDEKGIARRGLIIRHLVLPNNIAGTDLFVRWVVKELPTDTYVNIMAQYHPEYKARDLAELSRRITTTEWRQALTWAMEAGLTNLDR